MDARLIHSPPLSGADNMALDESLLHSAADGPPTLRFYSWSEATLSLGYFQSHADRLGFAKLAALPLVRRASGGGAILHHHELTYSFTGPVGDGPAQYVAFHETLIDALAELGVQAGLFQASGRAAPEGEPPFLCFERRAPQDIVAEDVKLVGSAQRKLRTAMLQHGSILLAASHATPQLPGLSDVAGRAVSGEAVQHAWTPRLAERLGLRWQNGEPTTVEQERAAEIRTLKFSRPEWTERR